MFRSRAERKVEEAGYDPARLPPGQYLTDKWPVLHAGTVPQELSTAPTSESGVLMLSTMHEPAVAVYPDSDKIGVWPGSKDDHNWSAGRAASTSGIESSERIPRMGLSPNRDRR
jgi:hypothetical protein